MPLYYLHLRDGIDEVLDPDGTEIAADAVHGAAVAAARDCIAGDAKSGRIELRFRIDVEDSRQQVVCSVSFSDAVEIVAA